MTVQSSSAAFRARWMAISIRQDHLLVAVERTKVSTQIMEKLLFIGFEFTCSRGPTGVPRFQLSCPTRNKTLHSPIPLPLSSLFRYRVLVWHCAYVGVVRDSKEPLREKALRHQGARAP